MCLLFFTDRSISYMALVLLFNILKHLPICDNQFLEFSASVIVFVSINLKFDKIILNSQLFSITENL